jgi:hypothetical protein
MTLEEYGLTADNNPISSTPTTSIKFGVPRGEIAPALLGIGQTGRDMDLRISDANLVLAGQVLQFDLALLAPVSVMNKKGKDGRTITGKGLINGKRVMCSTACLFSTYDAALSWCSTTLHYSSSLLPTNHRMHFVS